jgi:hypothetical protein
VLWQKVGALLVLWLISMATLLILNYMELVIIADGKIKVFGFDLTVGGAAALVVVMLVVLVFLLGKIPGTSTLIASYRVMIGGTN